MSVYPPITPRTSAEPPDDAGQPTDLSPLREGLPVGPADRPASASGDTGHGWLAVILVVIVLGSAIAMMFTGHDVSEALLLAGGVTLLGVAIARRILTQGALLPTIAIACAVAAFAVVLIISGYGISDVAMIAGGAGLVAGEVTAWVIRTAGSPRQGV